MPAVHDSLKPREEVLLPGQAEVDAFCEALRVERNASEHTIRAYAIELTDYLSWAQRAHVKPLEVCFHVSSLGAHSIDT